jgi:hypothetical protein
MNKGFILILFLSCTTSIKTKVNEVVTVDYKYLHFLKNYESSVDSIGDKIVSKYVKLNLVKETRGKEWLIALGGKKVLSGDYGKYRYLMEVYNNTHLLISCVPDKSFSAGPETFERDSVVIMDLFTGALNKTSLPKTYLTRSNDFLFKSYRCPADTLKYKEGYKYCAIDSIDMANYKLVLINQCHQVEEFAMIHY